MATLAIYNGVGIWNEFIFANILITNPDYKTLPVGLLSLKGTYNTNYAAMSAALVLSALPIIAIYIAMSGRIQAGMVTGAVKS